MADTTCDVQVFCAQKGPQPWHLQPDRHRRGKRSAHHAPAFSRIRENGSLGTANYHALQASLEKRLSHNLQARTSFTWSRTEDTFSANAGASGGRNLPDPFNIRFNFRKSGFNVPVVSGTNVVYTTPGLEGRKPLLREALGGWEITGIYTLESGYPFTVTDSANNSASQQGGIARTSGRTMRRVRTSASTRAVKSSSSRSTSTRLTLSPSQGGTYGNTPRNFFQGPGTNSGDIGFIKNFSIRERGSLQFR